MARYIVVLSKLAEKQLDKLESPVAMTLLDAIGQLADNPRPPGCKKLAGRNAYRIRKGDYRMVYHIFDSQLIVDVIAIGHRKDIY